MNKRNRKIVMGILLSESAIVRYLISLTGLIYIFSASACGKVNATDQSQAERVYTTQAGYTCFIIRDEEGKAVGGNCLKD